VGESPWRFKSSHPHSESEQAFSKEDAVNDAHNVPKRLRFGVALEGESGRWSDLSSVALEDEPREGDVLTLEGLRTVVTRVSTDARGEPLIWVKRLPPE
jgi:hypothetical protein